jgi:TonB-linked SusC/RagA family outer membrane protein
MAKLNILFLAGLLNAITMGAVYSSNGDGTQSSKGDVPADNIQLFTVSGQVTDASTGEPLVGVTVIIKGTTTGVITDLNGNYSINISQREAVLLFSFVGYASTEVMVNEGKVLNIALEVEALGMEEVVVIGYGVQKKESLVGAITQTTKETLERRGGVNNLSAALSGQLPGVTIMQRGGQPGRDEPVIYIRGLSTWNDGQPLLLVDGIERPINDIDINEVESVSVLKDASATAVFGVKGANGVILITTRRGQTGKTKFSASANYALKTISKMPRMMESYEQYSYWNKAQENNLIFDQGLIPMIDYTPWEVLQYYKKPQDEKYKYVFPNVDWADELVKDFAHDYRFNLNISGGTDFVKYFGSLSYSHEGDILYAPKNPLGYNPGFRYDRINFRGNLDFKLTKTTDLSVNLSGFSGIRQEPNLFEYYQVTQIFTDFPPSAMPIKHEDGSYGRNPFNVQNPNPAAMLWETGVMRYNRGQMASDVKLNQKLDMITKGLSVSARLSYDTYIVSTGPNISDGGNSASNTLFKVVHPDIIYAQTREDSLGYITYMDGSMTSGRFNEFDFQPSPITYGNENVSNGQLSRSLFYQFSVNYARTFAKHDLAALALMNRRENATGAVFPSYREDWVGRITYNFDRRYFAEMNAAYNGSEKFGPEYRFGLFPSLALGWMVSNEKFLDFDWLNELKIRASIGKVGSDAGIPRWAYLDAWGYDGSTALYFGIPNRVQSPYRRYYEDVIANPNLKWETALKQNIGFDLGLLSNQFRMSFDYFKDIRTDIFINASQRTVPVTFGAPPVPANLGATETTGFEVEMTYRKRWENGWSLWLGESITRASDIITKYEDAELLPDYLKTEGYMIGQMTSGIREQPIMQTWDDVYASASNLNNINTKKPGSWSDLDYNADGIINSFDAVPYGFSSSRPQNTYMTTLGFGYKNFNFMMQFYGVSNINNRIFHREPGSGNHGVSEYYLNTTWSADNPVDNPRYGEPGSPGGSDTNIFDGSYVRLKTMEISYSLPARVNKFLAISNAKLFINGNNLFLWTDLPIDLERGNTGQLDSNVHPMYKQFNFGINVDF